MDIYNKINTQIVFVNDHITIYTNNYGNNIDGDSNDMNLYDKNIIDILQISKMDVIVIDNNIKKGIISYMKQRINKTNQFIIKQK